MNNIFPSLLLVLPMLFLVLIFMARAVSYLRYYIHIICCILYLILASYYFVFDPHHVTSIPIGGWKFEFSIVLKFDFITKFFAIFLSFLGFVISLYMYRDEKINLNGISFYFGYWLLILSTLGVLSTQDIFNLYVWLEVMLVASVAIITASINIDIKSALKEYAFINIFSTLMILLSIGLIYGQTGILSYQGIASYIHSHHFFVTSSIYILIIGLLVKGAAFPFYFWLPNTYSNISTSSTLMLSSFNTKLIMIAFIRLFVIWSQPILHVNVNHVFLFFGITTMFFGVMGAANQYDIKRILSYHITSQLGYMLLAISVSTKLGFVAAIYFIVHNVLTKSTLFMTAGYIEQNFQTTHLDKLGNILSQNKVGALIFFVAAMSLAGFPPLSGFIGKYLVLKSVLLEKQYLAAFFVLFVSLFTLYSMIKIWRYGYCEKTNADDVLIHSNAMRYSFYLSSGLLLLTMLLLGLFPDSLLNPLFRFFG